jgi:regulator of replication initiation timing
MAKQDDALKYLLGLESLPASYEISKASDEELEERVTNWQEQIFTLAGELQDLKKKLASLEQKNAELEEENMGLLKQKLKVGTGTQDLKERGKYNPAVTASQLLKDNLDSVPKDLDYLSSQNKLYRNLQSLKHIGMAKSLDFRSSFTDKKESKKAIKQELSVRISEGSDLLYVPESESKEARPEAPVSDAPKVENTIQQKELEDAKEKLSAALEKIASMETELISQKEYYEQELKVQEDFFKELLEKKSYLPASLESLDQSWDFPTEDLTFIVDGSTKYVKSGSILSLVDYLTDPEISNVRFLQIFVFSYPVFMEAKTLLKMIFHKVDLLKDTNDILKISRLINILKYWIDNYYEDFEKDSNLLVKITTKFQSLKTVNSLAGMSEMILKQLDRKKNLSKTQNQPIKIPSTSVSPTSHGFWRLPSVKSKNGILLYSPEEVAKQLTLLDFKYFASINIREFLELNWMRKDAPSLSPGLTQMIKWSNHVSFWVTSEILAFTSVKKRVQIMEFMINLANVFKMY